MATFKFIMQALRPAQGPLSKMVGAPALQQIAQLKSGGLTLPQLQEISGEAITALQDQINAINTILKQQGVIQVDGSELPFTPPGGTSGQIQTNNGAGGFAGLASTGTGNAVRETSPTIVTPTIASFANAQHDHQSAAGGGTLAEAALALTDVTTNNASSAKHGFQPKSPADATLFLNGATTPAYTNPQTPWTQNISGGGFTLTNVASVSITNTFTAVGAGGATVIVRGHPTLGFGEVGTTSAHDLSLIANATEEARVISGGGFKINNLPAADPGAGSRQIWYDPGDGNRVKYSP